MLTLGKFTRHKGQNVNGEWVALVARIVEVNHVG